MSAETRILLVDEDMRRAYALAGRLADTEMITEIAASPASARSALERKGPFAAVLSCGGANVVACREQLEALTTAAGTSPPTPVIIVPDSGWSTARQELGGAGMVSVLEAQFDLDRLRESLREARALGAHAA